jgi:hypothetical protein
MVYRPSDFPPWRRLLNHSGSFDKGDLLVIVNLPNLVTLLIFAKIASQVQNGLNTKHRG